MKADYAKQIKTNNIVCRLREAQEAMRAASAALLPSDLKYARAWGEELGVTAYMIDEWIEEITK